MFNDSDFARYLLAQSGGAPVAPAPASPGLSPLDRQVLGLGVAPLTPPGPPPAGLQPVDRQALGLPAAAAAPAPTAPPIPQVAFPPSPAPLPTPQGIANQAQSGYEQERAGILAGAQAKGEAARVQGEGELKAAQDLQRRQAEDAAATAQASQEIAQRRQQLQSDVEDLANTRVDPNRLVKNMSTFQKIGGAIAIALGGLPTAFGARNGNQNVALSLIENQINKDIQAQMADVETKKSALNAKGTLLQQDIALGRDAADARTKATMAAYDVAIREVQAQTKMLGTQQAAAEGQQLIGQLEQKKSQIDEQHWAQQQQIALQRAQVGIAAGHLAEEKKQNEFGRSMQAGQFMRQLNEDISNAPLKAAQTSAVQAKAQLETAQAKKALGDLTNPQPGQITNPEMAIGNFGKAETYQRKDPTTGKTVEDVRFVPQMRQAAIGDKTRVAEAQKKVDEMTTPIQLIDANLADMKQLSTLEKLGNKAGLGATSEVLQRIQGRSAMLEQLAHGISGRVTPENIKLLREAMGDPTALIGRETQLKSFREFLRSQAQSAVGGVGITERWEPPSGDPYLDSGAANNAPPPPLPQGEMNYRAFFRGGPDSFEQAMLGPYGGPR